MSRKRIVVIGNGMVGYKFCDKLVAKGGMDRWSVTIFGEETRPAYDRVQLTKYFAERAPITLAGPEWYAEEGIDLRLGDKAASIDREKKEVVSQSGARTPYDKLVIATGSAPFVPPVPGIDKQGVFVYRTIEDLDGIIAYAGKA